MFSKNVMFKNIAKQYSEMGIPCRLLHLSHCICTKKELIKIPVNVIKKDKAQEVK